LLFCSFLAAFLFRQALLAAPTELTFFSRCLLPLFLSIDRRLLLDPRSSRLSSLRLPRHSHHLQRVFGGARSKRGSEHAAQPAFDGCGSSESTRLLDDMGASNSLSYRHSSLSRRTTSNLRTSTHRRGENGRRITRREKTDRSVALVVPNTRDVME